MGKEIDGNALSKELNKTLRTEVQELKSQGVTPKLSVLYIGDNPASAIYVKNKEKAALKLGIKSVVEKYPPETPEEEILARINELNDDPLNHGILIQLPLPKQLNEEKLLEAVNPEKDVDGFHPINMGRLFSGKECLKPCTAAGIMHLIESTGTDPTGKDAVVVGRSNIVGKPVAIMLLHKHATVTICHSRTVNLPEKIRGADILIAAIGRTEFVRGDWIKPGAIVIDVGINRAKEGGIRGDVQFEIAKERAAFITPVPGGVGPMTISMLMKNTITTAKLISFEKEI